MFAPQALTRSLGGALRHALGLVLPLDGIVAAQEVVEGGRVIGTVVLHIETTHGAQEAP